MYSSHRTWGLGWFYWNTCLLYPQPSIHRDDPVYQIICLVCVVQALEEKCLFEKMGASGLHKVFECMPDYNPIVGADAGTPQASYQVCEQWFKCSNGPAPSAFLPLFLTACGVCIRWRSRGSGIAGRML